ncbi:LOW QUALITY PROTEIN: NADH-dependent butanol dehydrogenase A [Geomicrobium sp. JCM 19055]|nr:LOW QUALITY PROTEIN: NADH-dependent butanol dehydrogenase A [Geomicrobium sp. JCM 19055]
MLSFSHQSSTKLIVGTDSVERVGKEIRQVGGTRVLLHYGSDRIKQNGLYDQITQWLQREQISYVALGGVKPNPTRSLVLDGIELCREENVDFILAVGGGSVIDSAKAIAVGVEYEGDVWDFFSDQASVTKALPIGALVTLPASGSEASADCVLTHDTLASKRDMESNDYIRPQFALLNPDFTNSLSKKQLAIACTDIFSHVFERYFSQLEPLPFVREWQEATLRSIVSVAKDLVEGTDGERTRTEMMLLATVAHNDWLSLGGIEGDWSSHAIEHELSGKYADLPHGTGLAIVMPAWMKYVYKTHPERFAAFAHNVFSVIPTSDVTVDAYEGIKQVEAFLTTIGMPTSLQAANLAAEGFEEMAKNATLYGPIGDLEQLHDKDIIQILTLAQK